MSTTANPTALDELLGLELDTLATREERWSLAHQAWDTLINAGVPTMAQKAAEHLTDFWGYGDEVTLADRDPGYARHCRNIVAAELARLPASAVAY